MEEREEEEGNYSVAERKSPLHLPVALCDITRGSDESLITDYT